VDVTHEAPRAVAALLDLPSVGIEYAVMEVGTGLSGQFDLQDLIAPHPQMAVCDQPHLILCQGEGLNQSIQNHEIIARTVHFSEF